MWAERDVEVQPAQRRGELVEQARPVQARDLDDRVPGGQRVVDDHLAAATWNAFGAALRSGPRAATASAIRISPFSARSMCCATRSARRSSSSSMSKARRDEDGVERQAVGGGEDLRVDDVGARRRAGAGDDRQQAGMVLRRHGEFGDAAEAVGRDLGGRASACSFSAACRKSACLMLARQVHLQPVGRIVAGDIGVDLGVRPGRQARRSSSCARFTRWRAIDRPSARRPARSRSPSRACAAAGPSSRSRRPGPTALMSQTVSTSSIFSRSSVCTVRGEGLDGLGVGEVAALRDGRHQQMVLDEPGDEVRLGSREAEARAELARDRAPGDRVVLRPALGDVVDEQRHRQHRAVADGRQDLVGDAAARP